MVEEYNTDNVNELVNQLNETMILQAKGFNHSVEAILEEISLLKKDNNFLMNFVMNKLNITEEGFKDYVRRFEENYPQEIVDEYLEKFKMKIFTDKGEFKKIVDGEDKND